MDPAGGPRAVAPWALGTLAVVFLLSGIAIGVLGKSAVHEIEGLIAILIAAVFLIGAVTSHGLYQMRRQLWEQEEARQAAEDELRVGPRRPI